MIVRSTGGGMTTLVVVGLISLLSAVLVQGRGWRSKRFNSGLSAYNAQTEALWTCLLQHNIEMVDAKRNDSHTFFEASQGDNVRFHWHPVAIAYPRTTAQTSEAVKCAKQNGNVQTVARSGGHAFSGYSSGGQDGALIVDFREMATIQPDSANAVVHVQPGARLGDVAKALWNDGKRATPHGTCPTVGVGGHTLCGGVGPMSRKWGMSSDNLVAVEVVLANGTVVTASEQQNADLWWAMRGAGSFYGLATKYTLTTYSVNYPVTSINVKWYKSLTKVDDLVHVMRAVQRFALHHNIPSELGFHVMMSVEQVGSANMITLQLRGLYLGAKSVFEQSIVPDLWQEVQRNGAPKADETTISQMDYIDFLKLWDDFGKDGDKLNTVAERKNRNNFVQRTSLTTGQTELSEKALRRYFDVYWQLVHSEQSGSMPKHTLKTDEEGDENTFWAWMVFFELFGGPNNRMRDQGLIKSNTMAHRDGLWLIQASVGTTADRPLVHGAYTLVHNVDGALKEALHDDGIGHMGYSCYADATMKDWKEMYYGKSIDRMVEIKKRYDPTNLFRTPQTLIETPSPPPIPGMNDEGAQWLGAPHPLP